jgi:uncharacterized protein with PQ loop repeat
MVASGVSVVHDPLTTIFGVIGAVCFGGMFVPQALLNWRRSSTAGLSLVLVVMWHTGAVLVSAYAIAERLSSWTLGSMAAFAALCAVLEAQMYGYGSHRPHRDARMALLLAVDLIGSAGLTLATSRGLPLLPLAFASAIGVVLPSVLLGLGFFPQFLLFIRTRSIAGYSFFVTAMDVSGCVGNVVVLVVQGERTYDQNEREAAWLASAPFLTIIGLHCVLLLIAAWVVLCTRPREGAPARDAVEPDAGVWLGCDAEDFYDAPETLLDAHLTLCAEASAHSALTAATAVEDLSDLDEEPGHLVMH